jgi:hypothetical protein
MAVIEAAGGICVSGTHGQEVQRSIERMIARERGTGRQQKATDEEFAQRWRA